MTVFGVVEDLRLSEAVRPRFQALRHHLPAGSFRASMSPLHSDTPASQKHWGEAPGSSGRWIGDCYFDLESFLPGSDLALDCAPRQESRNPGGGAEEPQAERQSFSCPQEKALSPQMHRPESEGAVRDISKEKIAGAGRTVT